MRSIIFHALFPQQCIFCKREGSHCCTDCLSLISITRHLSPLPAQSPLSGLFCATSFQDRFVQQLIRHFKYQPLLRDLAKPLAFLIVSHFALLNKQISPPDMICPIPLHKRRLQWRGYNHAEELAKQLAYAFSVPQEPILLKTRNTKPQVNLKREQRLRNMKGVFQVQNREAVQQKTILLIDDVYTTGATMQEAAKTLKAAGAAHIFAVTVARD